MGVEGLAINSARAGDPEFSKAISQPELDLTWVARGCPDKESWCVHRNTGSRRVSERRPEVDDVRDVEPFHEQLDVQAAANAKRLGQPQIQRAVGIQREQRSINRRQTSRCAKRIDGCQRLVNQLAADGDGNPRRQVTSDESGRREIYVRGFAPDRSPATAVGQWQISAAGGDKPRWSNDGTQLFYINLDGELMSVPVRSGTTFEPGVPKRLFKVRVAGYAPYDVAPDGRFLVNAIPDAPVRSTLVVMVDWQSRLRKGTSR